MSAMAALVRAVPAVHLRLGGGVAAAVEAVAAVCRDPAAALRAGGRPG
jgi:hypothetical protein